MAWLFYCLWKSSCSVRCSTCHSFPQREQIRLTRHVVTITGTRSLRLIEPAIPAGAWPGGKNAPIAVEPRDTNPYAFLRLMASRSISSTPPRRWQKGQRGGANFLINATTRKTNAPTAPRKAMPHRPSRIRAMGDMGVSNGVGDDTSGVKFLTPKIDTIWNRQVRQVFQLEHLKNVPHRQQHRQGALHARHIQTHVFRW